MGPEQYHITDMKALPIICLVHGSGVVVGRCMDFVHVMYISAHTL